MTEYLREYEWMIVIVGCWMDARSINGTLPSFLVIVIVIGAAVYPKKDTMDSSREKKELFNSSHQWLAWVRTRSNVFERIRTTLSKKMVRD